MSKKSVCLAYLTVALLLSAAGVAFAAAVTVRLVPVKPELTPDASGRAVLNYVRGTDQTRIIVNCRGLKPGQQYGVRFGDLAIPEMSSFTTNSRGAGQLRVTLDGDWSGGVPVEVLAEGDPVLVSLQPHHTP